MHTYRPSEAELWVAGYPSAYGGADTELDHLIDLWRLFGVEVHLVPNGEPDRAIRAHCDRRGCVTHTYRPDIFRDKLVVSLCNGEFLNRLPGICAEGRPQQVVWINCMTWTFPQELECHKAGLLDRHAFQSDYQRRCLLPPLSATGVPVQELAGYRPYFSPQSALQKLNYEYRVPADYFGLGRISRDDAAKYPEDMWRLFAKVTSPLPTKTYILGFGPQAMGKTGKIPPCNWLDYMVWSPGSLPVSEFYPRIHVLLHRTGSRENWPRAVIEAMASGVAVIAERDYGLSELITDGENGFLCGSSDEMSYRASQLAFDEPLRRRMVEAAHERFLAEHADPERSMAPWRELLETVSLADRATTVPPRTERVSLIIASRNQGRWLREALDSAVAQTVTCQVIAVDDCSIDDSPNIVREYSDRGVELVQLDRHAGVCVARNAGAALATGDFLVFLDGDDVLPTDFVQRHLEAMANASQAPFVYGPAAAFGDNCHASYWEAPAYDAGRLWEQNYVNTSALWRRTAFEAVCGWREGVKTMWDWDLALRATRWGTPRPSAACLHYRQHPESWSHQVCEKTAEDRSALMPGVRRLNAKLSVGCLISGRLPGLFPQWLSNLAQSIKLMALAEAPELVLLDNSRNEQLARTMPSELARYNGTFGSVRIIPYPVRFGWDSEQQRRDAVAGFMATACNRLRSELQGDIHWLVEDDVLVPLQGGDRLWQAVTAGWRPPHAVAGTYRNRHVPTQFVGGWWREGHPEEITTFADQQPVAVDFTGTGCLMYWPSRTPKEWRSHWQKVPAHDWAWGMDLKAADGTLLMLPAVPCGHARSVNDIIACT